MILHASGSNGDAAGGGDSPPATWVEGDVRFAGVFEHAPIGMSLVGLDGQVLRVNPAMCRMFGYTEQELLERPVMAITHPDDMVVTLEHLTRMVCGEQDTWCLEKRFFHKSGRIVWALSNTCMVRDPDGTPLYVISQVQDITARKEAEAEREQLYRHAQIAQQQLHTLSRRLMDAQISERRHLSRELHDEIGQLLSVLKLNLQLAERGETPERSLPTLRDSIAIVDRALDRVRRICLDLRPPLLDEFGLAPALQWLVKDLCEPARLASHVRISRIEHGLAADVETTCYRVAQSAITNVVRHARAQHLHLSVCISQGELLLTIVDDGIGFDVAAARSAAAQGASMGLVSMDERVLLVGGALDITSTPGNGTEVRARLPL